MTSSNLHDPSGPAMTMADLTPLPMAALMIGAYNLLQEGADLSQPHYISVSAASQRIGLQFPSEQASRRAITGWAHHFDATVSQHPHHDQRGDFTRVTATFGYYGLTVNAYAFIPASPAVV